MVLVPDESWYPCEGRRAGVIRCSQTLLGSRFSIHSNPVRPSGHCQGGTGAMFTVCSPMYGSPALNWKVILGAGRKASQHVVEVSESDAGEPVSTGGDDQRHAIRSAIVL